MSAVCPACGVTVVPGYVKCPKCHAALPYGTGRRGARTTIDPGGTALRETGFPVLPVVVAVVVALGIVLFFGLRGGKKAEPPIVNEQAPPTRLVPSPTQQQAQPVPGDRAAEPPAVERPNPAAIAGELERSLGHQRLWSTIEITGTRIDVRSALCGDPAMKPSLDGTAGKLHDLGLTRLRCVAQSGAVVFERDL